MKTTTNDYDLDIRLSALVETGGTDAATGYTSSPWTTEAVCCTDNCCG
ncbi:hypothetical protein [Kribbella yunnanensis]